MIKSCAFTIFRCINILNIRLVDRIKCVLIQFFSNTMLKKLTLDVYYNQFKYRNSC